MERPDTFIVRDEDSRPIGPIGHCTYCREPIGQPHAIGCVCRHRTVVYRVVMEMVTSEPADWTPEQRNFHKNEGTWCCDNFVEAILAPGEGCSCNSVTFEYARDATPEDELHLPRYSMPEYEPQPASGGGEVGGSSVN
jgi:hypothetical protein